MQSLRRTALSTARKGRALALRQPRRYAHDSHAHAHAPVNEPMGVGFWVTFSLIPAGWGLYAVSRMDDDGIQPFFTRMINRYMESHEAIAERNDRHVRMVEQAGRDRVLFFNTRPQEHVQLKFPEIMNVGSPYNVPAGSQVQLERVIEKYQKLAHEDNERKLEALMDNRIKSEQPFDRHARQREIMNMSKA